MDDMVVWMEELRNRVLNSYSEGAAQAAARTAAGTQPDIPFSTVNDMFAANVFYIIVTGVLYAVMKRRESQGKKGFNIKWLIAVYDLVCVFLAGYVVVGVVHLKLTAKPGFVCNVGNDTDPVSHKMAHFFWVFYAQKFWEFCDTWFFILRQSFRQVTFLHLFHHTSITLVVGLILPMDYAGDMYLPIVLNATVHVLMYSHYLVTALGFSSWWRKYLTSMQLTQFVCIAVQSGIALRSGSDCGTPDFAKVLMIAYMGSMLVLFGNFCVRRYLLKAPDDVPPECMGVIKGIEKSHHTFRGTALFDEHGKVDVSIPAVKSFGSGNARVTYEYQLTPVGAPMPSLHISSELNEKGFMSIGGGAKGCKVCWQVDASVILVIGEGKKAKSA